MDAGLLRTIAKFADTSPAMVANNYLGSSAYALGAGDDVDIPASKVFKHSILPYAAGSLIGVGAGTLAGYALPSVLTDAGVITPADPTGNAIQTLQHNNVDTSDLQLPDAPAPTHTESAWYRPDHPLVGQEGSDRIRNWSSVALGGLGHTIGMNFGRKEEFMHGVRDALSARTGGEVPWEHNNVGMTTQNVHIPWKTES